MLPLSRFLPAQFCSTIPQASSMAAAAASPARESPPPPVIGKAGRYTVFITPPQKVAPFPQSSSPKLSPVSFPSAAASPPPRRDPPASSPPAQVSPPQSSPMLRPVPCPRTASAASLPSPARRAPPSSSPAVQVPPHQFQKPAGRRASSSGGSPFGFFWSAVARVQDAHSSLDEHLAVWFGLNQSKYQWALTDYLENKCPDKGADNNQREVAP